MTDREKGIMFIHTKVSVALATFILTIAAAHTAIASAATPEENLIAAASSGPAGKLGPWLANVYDKYLRSAVAADQCPESKS
jgi:hypothetical protein